MLSDQHLRMLRESAIAEDVAAERGYRTVEDSADLEALGFSRAQRRMPGLLVPGHAVDGQTGLCQYRPDEPRTNKGGKPIKYETAKGARLRLDVPPRARVHLGDPALDLWITEGAKKADCLASLGVCAISVPGVFGWRGTGATGGKTALACWELVALEGRAIYLAFDSDILSKAPVQRALLRLKQFLEGRRARVLVVHLPDDGPKIGVDDFVAAGHTVDDLVALATGELPVPADAHDVGCYRFDKRGITLIRETRDGPVEQWVGNFHAEIVGDVLADDGVETSRHFEILARVPGEDEVTVRIRAADFDALKWVHNELGPQAIIAPERGAAAHVRTAIQKASTNIVRRRVRGCTGWVPHGDGVAFVHAGGAIGVDGKVEGLEVALPPNLQRANLPDPPMLADLRTAVQRSLRLLDVASHRITLPVLIATYLAPIAGANVPPIFLTGRTGTGKTAVAALAQQHFGAGFDPQHLPACWTSTDNALERQLSDSSDMLLLIDDFVAAGTEQPRLHARAERVLRGASNGSARQRLTRSGALRPDRPPRCAVLVTGEDVPVGHSLRARCVIVDVRPDDVSFNHLSECQQDADNNVYATAMSGFIRWVAADLNAVRRSFEERRRALRAEIADGLSHRRTPDAAAALIAGLEILVKFARATSAITQNQSDALQRDGRAVLQGVALEQAAHLQDEDVAARLVRLVGSALVTGRAHLRDKDGEMPADPGRWGWRKRPAWRPSDAAASYWEPGGVAIGWVDEQRPGQVEVMLDSAAAFAVATRLAQEGGASIPATAQTLRKRLSEAGFIRPSEEGGRQRLEVRKSICGERRRVMLLTSKFLGGRRAAPDDDAGLPMAHLDDEVQEVSRESEPEAGGEVPADEPVAAEFGLDGRRWGERDVPGSQKVSQWPTSPNGVSHG